jgi:hypothetical protein
MKERVGIRRPKEHQSWRMEGKENWAISCMTGLRTSSAGSLSV